MSTPTPDRTVRDSKRPLVTLHRSCMVWPQKSGEGHQSRSSLAGGPPYPALRTVAKSKEAVVGQECIQTKLQQAVWKIQGKPRHVVFQPLQHRNRVRSFAGKHRVCSLVGPVHIALREILEISRRFFAGNTKCREKLMSNSQSGFNVAAARLWSEMLVFGNQHAQYRRRQVLSSPECTQVKSVKPYEVGWITSWKRTKHRWKCPRLGLKDGPYPGRSWPHILKRNSRDVGKTMWANLFLHVVSRQVHRFP